VGGAGTDSTGAYLASTKLREAVKRIDFTLVEQAVDLMGPFDDATKALSATRHCSASSVLPMYDDLLFGYRKRMEKHEATQVPGAPPKPIVRWAKALRDDLESELSWVNEDEFFLCAALLDRRVASFTFPNVTFLSDTGNARLDRAVQHLLANVDDGRMLNFMKKTVARPARPIAALEPASVALQNAVVVVEDDDDLSAGGSVAASAPAQPPTKQRRTMLNDTRHQRLQEMCTDQQFALEEAAGGGVQLIRLALKAELSRWRSSSPWNHHECAFDL